MDTETRVYQCPFDHNEALEFDPLLRQLRTEAPVARIRMPHGDGHAWLVTRYEDVRTVVTDHRFSRAAGIGRDLPRMTPEPIAQSEAINLMDPPEHTRLRKLVAKGFTAGQVERMTPKVTAIVDRLIDEMAAEGPPVDFTRTFASRLPLTTICEVLDIPPDDQPRIRQLAMALMSTRSGQSTREAKAALRAYFLDLAAERRANPGDDLVSAIAVAREGDELLDTTEVGIMAMVLTITGHDTSTYQLSNILYTLLTHPEQLALLRSRPDLMEQALEELLRFIPFRRGVGIARVATEDVVLSGVTIRSGDVVHVSYLAANRDPEVFERPDELNIERPVAMHMTFGHGTHYCIGANLARAELRIAIDSLLTRFPELRLAVPAEQVPWHFGSIWRYPEELPITW